MVAVKERRKRRARPRNRSRLPRDASAKQEPSTHEKIEQPDLLVQGSTPEVLQQLNDIDEAEREARVPLWIRILTCGPLMILTGAGLLFLIYVMGPRP